MFIKIKKDQELGMNRQKGMSSTFFYMKKWVIIRSTCLSKVLELYILAVKNPSVCWLIHDRVYSITWG